MSHGRDEDPTCGYCAALLSAKHFGWCPTLTIARLEKQIAKQAETIEGLREDLREARATIERQDNAIREEGIRLGA